MTSKTENLHGHTYKCVCMVCVLLLYYTVFNGETLACDFSQFSLVLNSMWFLNLLTDIPWRIKCFIFLSQQRIYLLRLFFQAEEKVLRMLKSFCCGNVTLLKRTLQNSLNVYFYTELLERIAGAFLRLASPFQATLYQSFPVLWLTMLNLKRNLMISLTKSAKSVVRYAIFKMHIYQDYFTFFIFLCNKLNTCT